MRPHTLLLTLVLASAAACSTAGSEPEILVSTSPDIQITLAKSSYTRSELEWETGGIRARLVNGTAQPYYSRLGDAFNSAVEQDPLWVALGSDAALERESGAAWTAVGTPILVEGVREIRLGAGKAYDLIVVAAGATGPGSVAAGRYRVVVNVRAAPGAGVAERIVSAPFEVR